MIRYYNCVRHVPDIWLQQWTPAVWFLLRRKCFQMEGCICPCS